MLQHVTINQLKQLGFEGVSIDTYYFYLNEYLNRFKINTPIKLAHFFTQLMYESNKMKSFDISDVSARVFENNTTLGNVSEGDGVKYKPRGAFKLVGRNAYLAYSKFTGKPYLLNPTLLTTEESVCHSSCWFWSVYKRDETGLTLNELAEFDWFLKISFIIDGGERYKGFKNRLTTLKKAFEVFEVPSRSSRLKELHNQCKTIITSKKPLQNKYEQALKLIIPDISVLKNTFKDII